MICPRTSAESVRERLRKARMPKDSTHENETPKKVKQKTTSQESLFGKPFNPSKIEFSPYYAGQLFFTEINEKDLSSRTVSIITLIGAHKDTFEEEKIASENQVFQKSNSNTGNKGGGLTLVNKGRIVPIEGDWDVKVSLGKVENNKISGHILITVPEHNTKLNRNFIANIKPRRKE